MEKEIAIINKIIREAIIHGADSGGSYEQNEKELTIAINEWLKLKGLSDKCTLTKVDTGDGWFLYQIIRL